MMFLKGKPGIGLLVALLLVLSVALPAAVPAEAEASEGTWKGVTLLYTADVKGKIDPCG